MALVLNKDLKSGVTANYFRVTSCFVDVSKNHGFVDVALYLNVEARKDNKDPVEITSYAWSGDNNPFQTSELAAADIIALAYEKLRGLPEFYGSSDV